MSKFFRLCKANNKKHGLNDQAMELKSNPSAGRSQRPGNFCFVLSIVLICLIILVAGFYIFQITSSATYGFQISDQEEKLNQLKLVNEKLIEEVNSFEDLSYIKDKAVELGLAPVENVEYLEMSEGGMAVKK